MMNKANLIAISLMLLALANNALADDVKIIAAEFVSAGNNQWSVNVTLQHADTGWEHYADNWRVVDGKGNILGDRVLFHPHVDEQPFTRSLSGVKIPQDVTMIYVDAHDKVHGWTSNRMKIDLSKAVDGSLKVQAD